MNKLNMKNKKGELLVSETLKIIIAVICIGFLIYFLTSLYLGNKSSNDLEFAKESLQQLAGGLNSNLNRIEIYNPKGWVIGSWPYEDVIPNACSNVGWGNCLCICKDIGILNKIKPSIEKYSKKCDTIGTCLETEFTIDDTIKIKNVPLVLIIDYENKKIIEEK